jgi:membrane protein implicated in regulation of membrane protease activity
MVTGSFFTELQYWHWWIAGVGLVALEMLVPGTFFLWLGVSAGITGVMILVAPAIDWQYQILFFSVLSVIAIYVGRKVWRPSTQVSDHPGLNRRGEQIIGRVLTLVAPLANGRGKVRVGDTLWLVTGDDFPVGTEVRVTGIDGTILKVEPTGADAASDAG